MNRKALDYWEPEELENSVGNPLFKNVLLSWSKPSVWDKNDRLPSFNCDDPFLYILVRNHGSFPDKDRIEYVGLTTSPKTRFGNHETARKIVNQSGTVSFSFAKVEITRGRNRIKRLHRALEEIEHLLIWSIDEELWNEKKQSTLPGLGTNAGQAWIINNEGYRFHGKVPKEIVYPWIMLNPGRNISTK
jgi:hypothetical protein